MHKASTDKGFVAAAQVEDNYRRVWSRDATVCGLAALASGDKELVKTFRNSLETLWSAQHEYGFLPSNVDPDNEKVSYGQTAGRADTASWAIIGLCTYTKRTSDTSLLSTYKENMYRAVGLMNCWEFNGKQLIYVPQAADWADEYIQHGYILFDQLLRLWALELMAEVYEDEKLATKSEAIRKIVEENFFYRAEETGWYASNMIHQKEKAPRQFWWMGFNPAQIYHQFDLQANALALLMNLGTELQQEQVLAHIETMNKSSTILPSFSPVISEGDTDMKELKKNFAYRFRNIPHEFHNGGLWPVWNGWVIAALKKYGKNDTAQNLGK